jgi:hypothetical protein
MTSTNDRRSWTLPGAATPSRAGPAGWENYHVAPPRRAPSSITSARDD